MRKIIAVLLGKLIIFLSRSLKLGGGSAYSGLLALKVCPNLIADIAKRLPMGTIAITGTNGKTTTSKYLAKILSESKMKIVANHSGSNLARGIAAALIEKSSLFGKPRGDIGLFEIDEATMPAMVPALNPKLVLVTNIFRDQLDRYGELDKTAEIIATSLSRLRAATVMLNADDPRVCALYRKVPENSRVFFFGLGESEEFSPVSRSSISQLPKLSIDNPLGVSYAVDSEQINSSATNAGSRNGDANSVKSLSDHKIDRLSKINTGHNGNTRRVQSFDSKGCVFCSHELVFKQRYFAHMGDYFCPNCNFNRPNAEFIASDIYLNGVESSKACFSNSSGSIKVNLNLPGIYNIYNALGAFAAAKSLGISDEPIRRSLEKSTAAFGRTEKLVFNDRKVCLFLTKNPTGMSQVIETLKLDNSQKNLLLCLNDNYADGVDISWIWDVDIEEIDDFAKSIVCSGSRAHDMALRIKYAGYDSSRIEVENRIMPAFLRAANGIDMNETLYVLATYTAMLELRKHLTNSGSVSAFWKAS